MGNDEMGILVVSGVNDFARNSRKFWAGSSIDARLNDCYGRNILITKKFLIASFAVFLLPLSQPCVADSYTYDALNRLTRVAFANGTAIDYAYDAAGNLLSAANASSQNAPGKVNQTVNFAPAPKIAVGGTGIVSATASSGLAVSFGSTTPFICTVSGGTVTGVAAGTCTIAAIQAGNAKYNAAPQTTQAILLP